LAEFGGRTGSTCFTDSRKLTVGFGYALGASNQQLRSVFQDGCQRSSQQSQE
jgi:hypothetical protein